MYRLIAARHHRLSSRRAFRVDTYLMRGERGWPMLVSMPMVAFALGLVEQGVGAEPSHCFDFWPRTTLR